MVNQVFIVLHTFWSQPPGACMRKRFALFAPDLADQFVRDKRADRDLRQLSESADNSRVILQWDNREVSSTSELQARNEEWQFGWR